MALLSVMPPLLRVWCNDSMRGFQPPGQGLNPCTRSNFLYTLLYGGVAAPGRVPDLLFCYSLLPDKARVSKAEPTFGSRGGETRPV